VNDSARGNSPAVNVRKTAAKAKAATPAADLVGAQFSKNCGNATAVPIFDAAKMNTGAYGTNNLVAVSDPDIVLIGNQWWMIFASGPAYPRALAPVAAYLPPGASLATTTTYPSDPNGWHLVGAQANGQGTTPPISTSANSWDSVAAETPSADVGPSGAVSIYYAGHNAGQTAFQIGDLQNFNTSTAQATGLTNPVMSAVQPWEFSSNLGAVLEQSVRWMPQLNEYIMYYTAGAWWASPPDNTLAQAVSTDGINWTNHQKLDFPVSYYNQDFLYNTQRNRYEMVISNDPTGAGGANPRNLVWREAATPAVTKASWINETTLLQYNASNNATWYNSGILSPAVKYGNLPGETNRIYVFFHAYSTSGDMTIGRFYCDAVGVPAAQPQTITFNPISAQTVGTTLTVSATASSGLPVTFSVVPNGNCSVSGNVVSFLNTGNCGVVANQAGNGIYAAAPAVGQIIVVNGSPPKPIAQTISFGPIGAQYVGTTLTVSATASSGLPVTFSVVPNGNCSVSGNVVTFLNTGNCGVVANQAGNGAYAAAPAVGQIVVVNAAPAKPIAQTISFGPIGAQPVGATVTVSATASSGLPVSFSLVPNGNCSISGNVVTLLNQGNCGVVASQAGNSIYAPAPAVGQIVVVN
jgi:hypothetical protein